MKAKMANKRESEESVKSISEKAWRQLA